MPFERVTSFPSRSRMWQSKTRPRVRWTLASPERKAWHDLPSLQASRHTEVEVQIAPGMDSPHHLARLGLPLSTLHDGLIHNRELAGAGFAGNSCAGFSTRSTGLLERPMETLPGEETELPINQGGDNQSCFENQRPNHTANASQLVFPVQLLRIYRATIDDLNSRFRSPCGAGSSG